MTRYSLYNIWDVYCIIRYKQTGNLKSINQAAVHIHHYEVYKNFEISTAFFFSFGRSFYFDFIVTSRFIIKIFYSQATEWAG